MVGDCGGGGGGRGCGGGGRDAWRERGGEGGRREG